MNKNDFLEKNVNESVPALLKLMINAIEKIYKLIAG